MSTTPPNPERIFQTLNAHQATAALKAGIELGLFSAIARGDSSAKTIAERTGAAERGVRILCDYLCVTGLLMKTDGAYLLAEDAAFFLDAESPAYIGTSIRFLLHPDLLEGYESLTAAVRRGGTALDGDGTVTSENTLWVEFARGMARLLRPAAKFMAGLLAQRGAPVGKVLDVAAGHGLFGVALAESNPQAQIYAVDWAPVLEVAQENAERAGVAERFHCLPGSAFDVDFGDGYDVVLLTNFLHHFDVATGTGLMRKAHAALKPGGCVLALEFVPDEDRVSPPGSATFSLVMLATTRAGDAYTEAEYQEMFEAAGFEACERYDLPESPETVLVAVKRA